MLFGSRLNKLATSIRRALSEYAVLGINPPFVADFIEKKYLTGGASSTFSSAINHARAGNATMTDGYGPELVVNGGFDSDSDWTKGTGWSIADGVATANTTLKTHSLKSVDPYQGANGKTYIVTATFTMLATPNANAGVRINIGGVGENVFIESERSLQAGQTYTISGFGTPTDVSGDFYVEVGSTAHYAMNYTIDNVSVREMPVIKWAPHNLLTYSQNFITNWANTAAVSANAGVAPDGTTTAARVTFTAQYHLIGQQNVLAVSGSKATVGIWIKRESGNTNLTLRASSGANIYSENITVTDDWQLYTAEFTHDGTNDFG